MTKQKQEEDLYGKKQKINSINLNIVNIKLVFQILILF